MKNFTVLFCILVLIQLIYYSNSYCNEHCSFCYTDNPYNNSNFYIYGSFCAICQKPYVSLDGDCVLEESLPSILIQNDCDIYDYNLHCIKCENYDKENNAYKSKFLEKCFKGSLPWCHDNCYNGYFDIPNRWVRSHANGSKGYNYYYCY